MLSPLQTSLAATLIVATHNRAHALSRLLAVLASDVNRTFSWEVVVADNGSSDKTSELLRRNEWKLPLKHLYLTAPGKAKALNAALRIASGELVVFTDDDVTPSRGWIEKLSRAQQKQTNGVVFTGPIIPRFPANTPAWLINHPLAVVLYARYQPNQPSEGFISPQCAPFGPNFAVRREAIGNTAFREDLGPSDENGPLSYDDCEFLAEVRAKHSPFVPQGGFYYIPSASVFHEVRQEQISRQWIYQRFFNNGRSTVAVTGRIIPMAGPPLFTTSDVGLAEHEEIMLGASVNYYMGALFQLRLRGDASRASDLANQLGYCPAVRARRLLSPSAFALAETLW